MELIKKYFNLSDQQKSQFESIAELYAYWNEKINVISRKDINNIMLHHVLHSLAIAKVKKFKSQANILDVGTGGGFPGIPLAILFPETEFILIDSIGKKINVVKEISQELGLHNVQAMHLRAEEVKGSFDYVISRAVSRLNIFWPWIKDRLKIELPKTYKHENTVTENSEGGLLYLKGGDILDELKELGKKSSVYSISDFFEEPYFETKLVVHIPIG